MYKKNPGHFLTGKKIGIVYGTRTRVARVKGGSPRPLDEHDMSTSLEAGAGIEPAITILQTVALPLGDPAAVLCEDDSLEE